ncbi:MAG: DUF2341 domain-containing protein [Lentisphaerae bacterium]|nr:DUF2341 domain-containing protein [Lentisphaerota bacterium]
MNIRSLVACVLMGLAAAGPVHAQDPNPADWAHRRAIVFTGYDGAASLTNFPVLVTLEDGLDGFAYDQLAATNGSDLRFADSAGAAWLPYEIEHWDPAGRSIVWVRVPELSGTNTLIWALWGNPAATQFPAAATNGAAWSAVYGGVWHLSEPDARDSSGRGGHFTAYDGPAVIDGPIHRGLLFNGSNRLQTAGAPYEYAGPTTVEFWMRSDDASNQRVAIGLRGDASTRWSLHQFSDLGSLGGVGLWNSHNYLTLAAPGGLTTGQWCHVVFVDSGVDTYGTTAVYLNGAPLGTMPESFGKASGLPLVVGTPGTGYGIESWIGSLDEIRIAPAALPADWARAVWLNQVSNDTFETWQSAVRLANAGVANVAPTNVDLIGTLQYADGIDPLEVWVYWGTNDAGRAKEDWNHAVALGARAPGTLRVPVELPGEDTYTYRFYASNTTTEIWAEPSVEFISGAVTIAATQPATTEGSAVAAVFTVSRPSACARDALTVTYTLNGTADNGVDYEWLAGAVVLPAGETNAVITVTPRLDDDPYEAPQTVRATLAPGPYAVGDPGEAEVTIIEPGATEVPNQWSHRMRIDFSGYAGASTLSNFPALVVLREPEGGFHYSQCASAAGGDLRFLDAAQGRWLPYEIDTWRPGTNSTVWVRVPELAGTNTSIWALWGNSNATNPPAYLTNGSAWASLYAGVWHLTQTNALDSSTNGNHTTAKILSVSPFPSLVDGPVGGGLLFNGANRLQTGINRRSLEFNNGSIEFWMRPDDTFPNEDHGPIGMQSSTLGGTRWAMFVRKTLTGIGLFNGTQSPSHLTYPFAQGQWVHVTLVQSNGMATTYIDGGTLGSVNRGFSSVKNVPLMIGAPNDGGQYFIGAMDEVRLSPVVFSADWIRASWMVQASNSAFQDYVSMVSNDDASSITTDSAILNGRLNWDDGVPTAVWVFWGTNDAGRVAAGWDGVAALGVQASGNVSATVALSVSDTYYYRFFASNAVEEAWADPAGLFIAGDVTIDTRTPGQFTVRRPEHLTRVNLPVTYTLGGSASNGLDYCALAGRVIIPAGSADAGIPVALTADSLAFGAGPKTVVATLASGPYIVGSPDSAALTIENHPQAWRFRMPITFSGYTGVETLRNFPAPVVFSEGQPEQFLYDAFASPSGVDLRFTDGAQTRWLAYEIDEWNTGGQSHVWVQLPELAGTNTTVWAYWGNAFATAPPAYTTNGATWSANYQAVLHFAENSGTTSKDSSPNQFTGNLVGAPGPYWEAGKLGTALHFDGTDDLFNAGKNASNVGMDGNNPKTSEAWVNVDGPLLDNGSVFSMGNASSGNEWTLNRMGPSSGWASQHWVDEVVVDDAGKPNPIANWVHVAHTFDPTQAAGQTVKFYINGVQVGIGGPASLNVNTLNPVVLGCWYSRSWQRTYYDGYIDEARLANVTRSADWIKADWESQRAPAAFAVFGDVIAPPGGFLMMVR